MVNKSFDKGDLIVVLMTQDIANFNFKLIINCCKTNYNIMWKDKGFQLVMLPTRKESHLQITNKELKWDQRLFCYNVDLLTEPNPNENQYLYLLSDEEIKEGDWKYSDKLKTIWQHNRENKDILNELKGLTSIGTSKVIACLGPSLNLPQFPSSFLEEYVKRYNSKKSLEVEVDCNEVVWGWSSERYEDNDVYCNGEKVASFDYKEQERELDDFTEKLGRQPKTNPDNTISIRFKEEKMYSRSEVEELCEKAFDAGEAYRTGSCEGFKQIHPNKYEWIKENLK